MPLREFITGPGTTALAEGELVTGFECDSLAGFGGSFEKVGHRRSLVISIVCLAVLVKLDGDGRAVEDARLAIAGIRPVPRRLREIEEFLRGKPLTGRLLEEAADMPLDLVQSRTRQEYRRDVVRGFLVRGLIAASKRAGASPDALTRELETAYG
jgi:carbon-monoxide dehydrogenase medium subunit/xanthine dehydrogenase FAD-binding subunit